MAVHPDFPFDAADQCVKCGLCAPHCPSYAQTGHEGDAPRGRISLMDALARDRIGVTDRLEYHLDGCLGCRACEPVCPAGVSYGAILDAGRAHLAQLRPHPWRRLWITAVTHPVGQWLLARLTGLWRYAPGWHWRASRLARTVWARGHSLLHLGSIAAPEVAFVPMAPAGAATVWRFGSCVGAGLWPATDRAADAVLSAFGVRSRPLRGVCCGALPRHAGYPALADARRRAFDRRSAGLPVISLATGCGAELASSGTVQDITAWLRQHWRDDLPLQPLSLRVAVHRPCSHRNVLRSDADLDWLLARLPGLAVRELPGNPACCGAAGHHLLSHPALADGHLSPRLDALVADPPDVIVSSNVGCAVHLAAGLYRRGMPAIRVMHPVTLLAAAMAPAGASPT